MRGARGRASAAALRAAANRAPAGGRIRPAPESAACSSGAPAAPIGPSVEYQPTAQGRLRQPRRRLSTARFGLRYASFSSVLPPGWMPCLLLPTDRAPSSRGRLRRQAARTLAVLPEARLKTL